MEAYIKESFYGDDKGREKIRLAFDGALLDAVLDRYGEKSGLKPAGKGQFRIVVTETADSDFFSWLFRFGTGARILSPRHVAEQYREQARAVFKSHKK